MCHWNIMVTNFNALLWGILSSLFEWDFIYDVNGDNVLISKGNLGNWQPKIIVFNKACRIESLSKFLQQQAEEVVSNEVIHILIQLCMMENIPLAQPQMSSALGIHVHVWLGKLLKQTGQNYYCTYLYEQV